LYAAVISLFPMDPSYKINGHKGKQWKERTTKQTICQLTLYNLHLLSVDNNSSYMCLFLVKETLFYSSYKKFPQNIAVW